MPSSPTKSARQRALITGAASGIGRAFCDALAERGYDLAIIDIDGASLGELAHALRAGGVEVCPFVFDVADAETWRRCVAELTESWPQLDIAVHCAGILVGGDLAQTSVDDARRIVEVNLLGTIYGCRELAPLLTCGAPGRARRGVILMASIFAAVAPPRFALYSATKAGVLALGEALAGELAEHRLQVTIALPGATPTGLFAHGRYTSPELAAAVARYIERVDVTPAEVARRTLNAFDRAQPFAVIGRRARLFWRLKRWFPAWTLREVARRTLAALK